ADAATARPWIARAVTTARATRQLTKLSESLSLAATVESVAGDLEAARRYIEQAEEITHGLGDFPATIELLLSRAVLALVEGDLDTARAVSLEGLRLSREAGDLYQVEAMLGNLGMVGVLAGDLRTAKSRFVESLQVARQIDNRLGQYWRLAGLGWHAGCSEQQKLWPRVLARTSWDPQFHCWPRPESRRLERLVQRSSSPNSSQANI